MQIINNIKQLYYINSLKNGVNSLHSINNNEELSVQINNNLNLIISIKQILKEDNNPINYNRTLIYMFCANQFIKDFINKDFEDAFHLTFGLLNTSQNKVEEFYFGNLAIMALGQIKTQYMNNNMWIEYNTRFHNVEEQLMKLSHISLTPNSFENFDFFPLNINNINIGLAYLKFLSHDISQTESLLNPYLLTTDNIEQNIFPLWKTLNSDIANQENFDNFIYKKEYKDKLILKV
jgi:hypothetical protein